MPRIIPTNYHHFENYFLEIDFRYDPLISYLKSYNEWIDNYHKELEVKIESWNKKSEKVTKDRPSGFEFYEMDIIESGEFETIFYSSSLIFLYAMFEHDLNELCNKIKKIEGFSLSVYDLNGKGIKRARNYLTKVASIDFESSLDNEWHILNNFGKIRNALVHNEGRIKKDELNSINQLVKKVNGVDIDQNKVLISSNDLLLELIDKIKRFLNEITSQIISQKTKPVRTQ